MVRKSGNTAVALLLLCVGYAGDRKHIGDWPSAQWPYYKLEQHFDEYNKRATFSKALSVICKLIFKVKAT